MWFLLIGSATVLLCLLCFLPSTILLFSWFIPFLMILSNNNNNQLGAPMAADRGPSWMAGQSESSNITHLPGLGPVPPLSQVGPGAGPQPPPAPVIYLPLLLLKDAAIKLLLIRGRNYNDFCWSQGKEACVLFVGDCVFTFSCRYLEKGLLQQVMSLSPEQRKSSPSAPTCSPTIKLIDTIALSPCHNLEKYGPSQVWDKL